MVSNCPRTYQVRAARQDLAVGVDDARHFVAHAAQVAPVHGAVDIDHAADVVVVHRRHAAAAGDGGDVVQDLRGVRAVRW